jgi:16S rRNA (cytosine967-C5)-methyltransferase
LIDEEVVVQDRSSQRVLEPLQEHFTKTRFTAWDCCAASGGKTILLHDKHPQAAITVSDIRESIIINLKNRLKRAGLNAYRSLVADVTSPHFSLQQAFDLVICDAPCSGSGTWARTPEQLSFFPEEKIDYYAGLQKRIAVNASRHLTKGGAFLYITCSVFTRENENVVAYLEENTGLQLLTKKYFTGYTERGDTLFAALFTA